MWHEPKEVVMTVPVDRHINEAQQEAKKRRRKLNKASDRADEQSRTPRGRVRVSAPLPFGIAYLGSLLPRFLEAHPEITVDFALSDRKVDLVAQGFDLALRIATLENSSLLSRRLCAVRPLLVGAPAYLLTMACRTTRPN
jgi:DNA-binding transcriptional LysR family regulator